jgi:D-glycero-beta-D-manno-heptose-7-phosphate kinase
LKQAEINRLFESFTSKKVLIIGDVMVDTYLWGKVSRISPEAPVPVVNCSKRESRLGGAANVALNLEGLGALPILSGVIGNDDNGTLFLKLVQDNHLSNHGIFILKGRPTTVKTRVIGNNQQLVRIDDETDKPLEGKSENAFVEHVEKLFEKEQIDCIIFQDYDKGSLTPKVIHAVTSIANEKNIPVLVDPKKRNFNHYTGITLFKPNFREFCEGLKIEVAKNNFAKIFEYACEFQQQQSIQYMLITLSDQGVFISSELEYYHIPAHVRDIADVSGAGDTVVSVAGLCLAAGLKPQVVAAIANLAGGMVCEKVGVVPIDKVQLKQEIENISREFAPDNFKPNN